ncbi:unnamed protein product, partial [Ectocarpus fasciculatus]
SYGPPGAQPPSQYGPPGGNQYGGPPGAPNNQYGAPGGQFGGPPGSGAPSGGGPPGGPPSGGYGGPPGAGYGAPSGGPPSGGPPSGGPPGAGPPGQYGAPAPASGGFGGNAMPAPKSNVQFFSLNKGAAPTPSPNVMAAPPSGPGMAPAPPDAAPQPTVAGMPPPPSVGNQAPYSGGPNMAPPADYPGATYGAPPAQSMVGMPSAFEAQGYGNNMGGTPNSMPGQEMDLSIQCDPAFMRSTVAKVASSQSAATSSRVPLGLICRPMAGDVGTENSNVEVVDFGSTGIVRCKRCRTYINPFVSWTDSGRRYRCSICGMLNDVPNSYFSHLDQNGQRRDKGTRPELSNCSVEFIAPADYMVRPPQPPVYFFVIDVSSMASSSGMLESCVNSIKESLDNLPGLPRTQIGFITFDSSIHFYNLKSSLKAPQMLVVSDISDVILPSPEDLLVNLQDSREIVEQLLDSLPTMFKSSEAVGSCTGPALLAAKRVIQHVGGKLLLFQTCLPNTGEGTLKPRDNPRLLGTDKEHSLLVAEDQWYKSNGIDFSRLQIAVDTFLFANQYTDLATLAVLSKYTSGSTYFYPGFYATRDGPKFEHELSHCLTRAIGFEAVMRVRATRGLKISNFYGNYFIRGTDLLSLPNVTSDSTFGFDLGYEEQILATTVVTVQSALLYTTSTGERRIRVHTMILPVTDSVTQMLETVDIDCAVNMAAKQAVDIASKSGFENARLKLQQSCIDILRASRLQGGAIPASLQLLPLYTMSLQKNVALRGGADVRIDERAFFMQLLSNMDVQESKVFIYPRLFSIQDMSLDAGTPSDNADDGVPTAGAKNVRLPAIVSLTYERLNSEGIVLLENGYDMFLWVGRNVNPSIINTLFGVAGLDGVDTTTLRIQAESSDFSFRLNEVIEAVRSERSERFMQLHIIREGDGHGEAYFSRFLVEDRANFNGGAYSYVDFHGLVTKPQQGGGMGGGMNMGGS